MTRRPGGSGITAVIRAVEAGVLDTRCSMLRHPRHRGGRRGPDCARPNVGGMAADRFPGTGSLLARPNACSISATLIGCGGRSRLVAGDGTRIWLAVGRWPSTRASIWRSSMRHPASVAQSDGGHCGRHCACRRLCGFQEGTGTVPPWANEPARTPLQRAAIKLAVDEYRMSIAR